MVQTTSGQRPVLLIGLMDCDAGGTDALDR